MFRKIKNYYHLLQATSANILYGYPAKKLHVIGVTGTDGKTTTTSLIYHILKLAGRKAAMISTVAAYIGDIEYDTGFHVTTPSSFLLQKYIKKALVQGSEYLVLEVTSHALDQYRVYGIPFEIGVITNVTHEHLDYHKTYESYVKTKARLLYMAKVAVMNKDDESFGIISKFKDQRSKLKVKTQKFITYGFKSNTDVNPTRFPFKTRLLGKFNTYNCLAAIAVCRQLDVRDAQIREGIETFVPPRGRQEIVYDKDFIVMIDFAHTPAAFEKLLPEVGAIAPGRLIHVFGAAGERDSSKRPQMGLAASKFDDIIILTSEDPRSEQVEKINNEIESGIRAKKNLVVHKISDRREAIEFAVASAKKGDIVLLTGKSHEKSMNNGRGEEAWDEFQVAFQALSEKNN